MIDHLSIIIIFKDHYKDLSGYAAISHLAVDGNIWNEKDTWRSMETSIRRHACMYARDRSRWKKEACMSGSTHRCGGE
jgi:hypothetical protein